MTTTITPTTTTVTTTMPCHQWDSRLAAVAPWHDWPTHLSLIRYTLYSEPAAIHQDWTHIISSNTALLLIQTSIGFSLVTTII